ncbi:MAG TPA: FMN-binding negative transcriptional regulator [Bryobacteraceae bacterium]|nr:FMN-binding negative transcriptional regulator [Bryobacteraceae bacterium]
MYNPAHFKQQDPQALRDLMAQYPLAALVTLGSQGLSATHLPLLYDPRGTRLGVLHGHMAKANPQWSDLRADVPALALFTGPQHYISPNWYPSKAEHGKVVPTWNYVVVHARGPMRVIHDPQWLKENVSRLTAAHEAALTDPWNPAAAPAGHIENMVNAIVGIEITIESLEGKWKASQNRPEADRLGVIDALRELGTPEAARMAQIVSDSNRAK